MTIDYGKYLGQYLRIKEDGFDGYSYVIPIRAVVDNTGEKPGAFSFRVCICKSPLSFGAIAFGPVPAIKDVSAIAVIDKKEFVDAFRRATEIFGKAINTEIRDIVAMVDKAYEVSGD